MKRLIAKCDVCGATKLFSGETVEEILQAVGNAGWRDYPANKNVKFICKKCSIKKEK